MKKVANPWCKKLQKRYIDINVQYSFPMILFSRKILIPVFAHFTFTHVPLSNKAFESKNSSEHSKQNGTTWRYRVSLKKGTLAIFVLFLF